MMTIAVEDINAALDDWERQLEQARRIAVAFEQENAELGERLAGALAAARDMPCDPARCVAPDLCPRCCLIAQLEIPGSSHYYAPPF
jgi:hypothetical protein